MLELFAKHGGFDLKLKATGDLDVDQHHTVEDVGIVLGQLVSKALGDRKGINRAGYFVMTMDETLAVVALDLGGRPALVYEGQGEGPAGGRSANRAGGGFLRRLRESCGRESAREGAVRPVEPSQDRSDLQMFRARAALRVFERRAAEGSTAVHQRAVVITILDYGAGNLRSVQNTLAKSAPSTNWFAMRRAAARDQDHSAGRRTFRTDDARAGSMQVREALLERIRAGVPFSGSAWACRRCSNRAKKRPRSAGWAFRGEDPAVSGRGARAAHGLERD
jgi:hypothetical protein